jgi:hypothetical protein
VIRAAASQKSERFKRRFCALSLAANQVHTRRGEYWERAKSYQVDREVCIHSMAAAIVYVSGERRPVNYRIEHLVSMRRVGKLEVRET